jgi:hypothetical protein
VAHRVLLYRATIAGSVRRISVPAVWALTIPLTDRVTVNVCGLTSW